VRLTQFTHVTWNKAATLCAARNTWCHLIGVQFFMKPAKATAGVLEFRMMMAMP
jgi:hypothetical protein